MKFGYLINDLETAEGWTSSVALMTAAARAGHDVYVLGLGDLCDFADGRAGGLAVRVPAGDYRSTDAFAEAVQGAEARERLVFGDLDMLHLRYNPSEETGSRSWAREAGLLFGQMAVRDGTLVVNHPDTLAYATSKMYLEHFPEDVRPKTLISRDYEEIRAFFEAMGRHMILKPLVGYGGEGVFVLRDRATNLKALVETLGAKGYVVAQEYLPEAKDGDIRLLLVNGEPLQVNGRYAAIRRRQQEDDVRSNVTAGGEVEAVDVDERLLALAERIRPKLLADGLFYAGIDVVGDKLMEVNAIAAGSLLSLEKVTGVDFAPPVIAALERKVRYRQSYGTRLTNRELAVL